VLRLWRWWYSGRRRRFVESDRFGRIEKEVRRYPGLEKVRVEDREL
jgi:hypothetical protein